MSAADTKSTATAAAGTGNASAQAGGLNWLELSALLSKSTHRVQCAVATFLTRTGMSALLRDAPAGWAGKISAASIDRWMRFGSNPVLSHRRANVSAAAAAAAAAAGVADGEDDPSDDADTAALVYHRQQPTFLYLPELEARPYYDDDYKPGANSSARGGRAESGTVTDVASRYGQFDCPFCTRQQTVECKILSGIGRLQCRECEVAYQTKPAAAGAVAPQTAAEVYEIWVRVIEAVTDETEYKRLQSQRAEPEPALGDVKSDVKSDSKSATAATATATAADTKSDVKSAPPVVPILVPALVTGGGAASDVGAAIRGWRAKLNEKASLIRDEYLAVRRQAKATAATAVASGSADADLERIRSNVADGGLWRTFPLLTEGVWNTANLERCPVTSQVLKSLPLPIGNAIGYAYFSVLSPGTVITPHFGVSNLKLRLHLPLIVPTSDITLCGLNVADERRVWRDGETIVFDDSFEHSVWYHKPTTVSASTHGATKPASAADADLFNDRVVLLIDCWHPDLSQAEIELINRCMPASAPTAGTAAAAAFANAA